jgi:hypothetical protein
MAARMRVDVDEARRGHLTAGIDRPRRGLGDRCRDARDGVAAHGDGRDTTDRRCRPRRARSDEEDRMVGLRAAPARGRRPRAKGQHGSIEWRMREV